MKVSNNSTLELARLQRMLSGQPIGHTIHHYISVPSTMTVAQQLCRENVQPEFASAGGASGAIVVAEEQTSGRGRHERRWIMPRSAGLAVSICLKTPLLPQKPTVLPMMAAVAVLRSIQSVAPTLRNETVLKWPNDLLIRKSGESFQKVAGILLESSFQQGRLAYAIVGIGINVNQQAQDLPATPPGAPDATSLYATIGDPIDRTDLLICLCREFASLLHDEPSNIYREWRAALSTLGKSVSVQQKSRSREGEQNLEQTLHGVAVDTTPDGGLIVEDQQGERQTFYAGDVSLRISCMEQ